MRLTFKIFKSCLTMAFHCNSQAVHRPHDNNDPMAEPRLWASLLLSGQASSEGSEAAGKS